MLTRMIKIIIGSANYSILNSTFHSSYLCNILVQFTMSFCVTIFQVPGILFPFIFLLQ
jgi:hypothetical protein